MSHIDPAALVAGGFTMAYGLLLMRSARFVRWGYKLPPASLFAMLIGADRAAKVAKYLFGPLVFAAGLLVFLVGLIAPVAA